MTEPEDVERQQEVKQNLKYVDYKKPAPFLWWGNLSPVMRWVISVLLVSLLAVVVAVYLL